MSDVVRVGQTVPDFELEIFDPKKNEFGKMALADLKKQGKWTVLVFYPADYTFVCPTELADVADQYAELQAAGAEVISVSTDTKFVHLAWQREEKLLKDVKYPMGADTTGKVSRLFGVYDEASGLALRGTFIINPDGKLASSEVNFYNVGRSAAELLRKTQANAHLAKNPNEVCPANWSKGGKTLKNPGAAMVGRVAEALK
ncbi:MAG: peroxiredoxin [Elusimicrobia bacterium]|jgi:peroxiredoxin (alkyl hydroperoxide reductase subunit C)|nr:peroxiredoxin [Elusimicrobiota bacterium]MBK7545367.1 peroxiredoxin [Elusimicrobiota bacterium]MBK7575616.1 peroxiredoxin [Elusimicrobiota bacterium]MBK8127053.1 peroxiredoxin [Elusimicrobiota bacterium]MBK8424334.1 peroxiredoxin [Elusimicrobiota bacterium]